MSHEKGEILRSLDFLNRVATWPGNSAMTSRPEPFRELPPSPAYREPLSPIARKRARGVFGQAPLCQADPLGYPNCGRRLSFVLRLCSVTDSTD
jgi:hypothetical protein